MNNDVEPASKIMKKLKFRGYDVFRVMLSIVLIVAASLKAYQLMTEPSLMIGSGWFNGLLSSRLIKTLEIVFELIFGIWLLIGLYPNITRKVTIGFLISLLIVALYKTFDGSSTCGCFGKIEVNPWYMVIFDITNIFLLLYLKPKKHIVGGIKQRHTVKIIAILTVCSAISIPTIYISYEDVGKRSFTEGLRSINNKITIVKPEFWINKKLPIMSHIQSNMRLTSGRFVLVMYKPHCPPCIEKMPTYRNLARKLKSNQSKTKVVLVNVGQDRNNKYKNNKDYEDCFFANLSTDCIWNTRTPLALVVENSVVLKILSTPKKNEKI